MYNGPLKKTPPGFGLSLFVLILSVGFVTSGSMLLYISYKLIRAAGGHP